MRKYQIIYADPPWPHRSGSRHKVVPYPVMPLKAIRTLPVSTIAQKDSVLFLWTTDKYLQVALEVIHLWGFTYRTVAFNWVKKTSRGHLSLMMGGWTLKCTELCLLATRGKPHKLLLRRKGIHQLIMERTRGHSVKPSAARKRIELMFGPGVAKIELFARKKYPGWDAWGNEVRSNVEFLYNARSRK